MADMALLGAPPLGSQLAHELRRDILRGGLARDEHLVEAQVAHQYGVSRGPVREALKELERDGLVYSARQGYRVAELTAADVEEIYAIRFMTESMGIEAAQAAGHDWTELNVLAHQLKTAAQQDDQWEFSQRDMAFHRHLCEAGGGKRLQVIWKLVEPTLIALFEVNRHPAEDLDASAEEHLSICTSLQNGSDEWRAILKSHLDGACERFLRALEQRGSTKIGR